MVDFIVADESEVTLEICCAVGNGNQLEVVLTNTTPTRVDGIVVIVRFFICAAEITMSPLCRLLFPINRDKEVLIGMVGYPEFDFDGVSINVLCTSWIDVVA